MFTRRWPLIGIVSIALVGPAAAQAFRESPLLTTRVSAGQLKPLAERLPRQPLVVKPLEEVGKYGGQWRQAMRGSADILLETTIGYTRLVRWNREWTDVEPEVAEKVEVNANATEYVFTLREGLKWSDGQPFTTDDILFWYENVLIDKDITPSVPRWLTSGGKPVEVTKRDARTVVFTFASPNGMFLKNMATNLGADILAGAPAHWLKQFHRKHNPDVEKVVADAKAADWKQLFTNKVAFPNRWRDAARPVLDPWRLTVPYAGTQRVVAERNPFYFKVDTAGNQLPYIDRVTYDVIEDNQALILKAINGEIDMQNRHIDTTDARPLLVQNQQRSRYRLFKAQPAWSNAMLINLNQTTKNAQLKPLFSSKEFRVALSHAIDREELNKLIYAQQSKAWQAAPREGTALYDERMAKQFTEFDPPKANTILDGLGLTRKDSDGFRLHADGSRISFPIDVLTTSQIQIDALEVVKKYWRTVGIEMQVRPVERSLAFQRLQANNHDANAWIGGGGYDQLGILDPKWYFPHEFESSYATAWGIHFQNPTAPNAEAPPAHVKRQQELFVQLQQKPTTAEQLAVMKEILAIARDEFYVIGTNLEPDRFGIVKANMRNVPAQMPNTFFYMTPGPTQPEQYYYR
ncbi:MAG: ABC transporter substrate-binding protein [Beijerinckiaceae bacterium]